MGRGAALREAVGDRLGRIAVEVGHHHARAAAAEGEGARPADARAATGDQHHAPLKPQPQSTLVHDRDSSNPAGEERASVKANRKRRFDGVSHAVG
jgi:hypothetical protein